VDRVSEAWSRKEARFVLLTGEPGSGKSALMADLARSHPEAPRRFIRRDSVTPLQGGDARSFLFSVGYQLAALHPELFDPDKLEVVVNLRVGQVAAGGRAVGIQAEELRASPFYRISLHVQAEGEVVEGELVGLSVGTVVPEPRMDEVSNLQYLALLDPAAVLVDQDPEARIVVLVDALDEIRWGSSGESILDWLSTCPELPANVRIVCSCRPDPDLLRSFRAAKGSEIVELAIDPDAEADRGRIDEDLGRYLAGFAAEPAVASALEDHEVEPASFVDGATGKAQGNFQYVVALARGIDAALASDPPAEDLSALLRLEGVPAETTELYRFFLGKVKDRAEWTVQVPGAPGEEPFREPAWQGLYHPLLAVLAVAFEPLSDGQLLAYARLPSGSLPRALEDLGQFLDRLPDGRHRLYHATFPEFLTGKDTAGAGDPFHVDPAYWHALLAGRLTRANPDWTACTDTYALAHTPAHLMEAIRLQAEPKAEEKLTAELFTLAGDDEFAATQWRLLPGEPRLPAQVCELAFAAAAEKDDAPGMAEFALRKARRVESARTKGSPLAAAREIGAEAAWSLADLYTPEDRVGWHLLIAWELKDDGRPDVARVTLNRLAETELPVLGWQTVTPIFTAIRELDVELSAALQEQLLSDEARVDLVAGYFAEGNVAAALETAQAIEDGDSRAGALRDMARAQAEAGEAVAAVKTAQAIEDGLWRGSALAAVAEAQAEAGDTSGALETAQAIGDTWSRARALAGLARVQAEARNATAALDTVKGIEVARWAIIALADVAKGFAEAGNAAAALGIASAMPAGESRAVALAAAARAQAQAGDASGAQASTAAVLETARAINAGLWQEEALTAVAEAQARAGDASGALEIAEMIKNDRSRARALAAVAATCARAGDASSARATYAAAVQTAEAIEDTRSRAGALADVAKAQAVAGEVDATRTAQAIEDEDSRDSALKDVARAQAEAGDAVAALETTRAIGFTWLRSEAQAEVAKAQAEAGDMGAALQTAQAIEDVQTRSSSLAAVAQAQARAGEPATARATYAAALEEQTVEDASWRATVLEAVARAQLQAGEAAAARTTSAAALETAHAIKNEASRAAALAAGARIQAEAGDASAAIVALQAIEDEEARARALGAVATIQGKAGEAAAARTSFAAAIETAQTIEDGDSRSGVVVDIARAQAEAGDLVAAIDTAKAIEDASWQGKVLAAVAEAQASAGEVLAGLQTARAIEDAWWRTNALVPLARAQAEAGGSTAAQETYAAAVETAQTIESGRLQSTALATVARGQAETGDTTAALATAQTIEDAESRAKALTAVAHAHEGADNANAARTAYASALKAAQMIEDAYFRARAEAEAGDVSAALETVRAIELFPLRLDAIASIVTLQARRGSTEQALDLLRSMQLWPSILSGIASAIADPHHAVFVKQVIVACAEYLALAPEIIGCLARTYPDQATGVARRVLPLLA
jgi:hypothetical protein